MTATGGFAHQLSAADELAVLYREPSQLVRDKEVGFLDRACREFIALSPFVLVGTADPDGGLDVSPKGGAPGFVHVLDDHRLAIPDLNGNNRLDSIHNIIRDGRAGLLFLLPGMGEMLRLNGTTCVTTDPEILDGFSGEVRRPRSAIGVTVEQGFLHCAKSIRRGGLWDPDSWLATDEQPSPGRMLVEHAGLDGVDPASIDAGLETGYAADLEADRPEAS